MADHNNYARRGANHYRQARKANPLAGFNALNPPKQDDLHIRDLLPRFSPTATYPDDPEPTNTTPAGLPPLFPTTTPNSPAGECI